MRSGAQTLVLLASPLVSLVLRALSMGPKQQAELRREIGLPAQTTLRAQLRRLIDTGIVEKRRLDRFPGTLEYELTAAGRELLFVADVLECWLERAPQGRLELGGSAAKAAVKALAEGWSTTMVRALSAGPLALTELDAVIGSLSYPSLERRLVAMRLAGQVEVARGNGRGTPYAASEWLRQGVAPLLAACRWERRCQEQSTAPLGALDVEATFLLTVLGLSVPSAFSGTCRLAASVPQSGQRLAGVMVELKSGMVVACHTKPDAAPSAWALGPAATWLTALIDADLRGLEFGGDCDLARALVEGLHRSLFRVPEKATSQ